MLKVVEYGNKPIYLRLLKKLRIKKGFVCFNMSNGLITEFRQEGFLEWIKK